MSRILLLSCSPHSVDSLGTRLAQHAVDDVVSRHHGFSSLTRDLARAPLPPLSAGYAQAVCTSAPPDAGEFSCSETLIQELEQSDILVIATPMHNFTVPAALKLWIDYVLRKDRSFIATPHGKVGTLKDRPTLVVTRAGAQCTGDNARQPDFLTPYLTHALSTLGIHSVQFSYVPSPSSSPSPSTEDTEAVRLALGAFFAAATPSLARAR
ncbi:FMN-dependent NADH-azoreductase [Halomonas sp. V046]|uniref:FMN-dependent NADH-azoreductase n=1 Tax=Halomonas sp. V046 TaxID=3459611 RepID=UPI004044DCC1